MGGPHQSDFQGGRGSICSLGFGKDFWSDIKCLKSSTVTLCIVVIKGTMHPWEAVQVFHYFTASEIINVM